MQSQGLQPVRLKALWDKALMCNHCFFANDCTFLCCTGIFYFNFNELFCNHFSGYFDCRVFFQMRRKGQPAWTQDFLKGLAVYGV